MAALIPEIAMEAVAGAEAAAEAIPSIGAIISQSTAGAVEGITSAFSGLSRAKQLGMAGKTGMWGEFIGERAYNKMRPFIKRYRPRKWKARSRARMPTSKSKRISSHVPYTRTVAPFETRPHPRLRISQLPRSGVENEVFTAATLQPGTVITHLCGSGITQGNTMGQRLGDRVFLKGVSVRCTLLNANTGAADSGWIRHVFAENKRPLETVTDKFFDNNSTDTNAKLDFGIGGPSIDRICLAMNTDKYRVIKDVRHPIRPLTTDNCPNTLFINFYCPVNRWITYNTDGTIQEKILPLFVLHTFVERNDGGGAFTANLDITNYYRSHFRQ